MRIRALTRQVTASVTTQDKPLETGHLHSNHALPLQAPYSIPMLVFAVVWQAYQPILLTCAILKFTGLCCVELYWPVLLTCALISYAVLPCPIVCCLQRRCARMPSHTKATRLLSESIRSGHSLRMPRSTNWQFWRAKLQASCMGPHGTVWGAHEAERCSDVSAVLPYYAVKFASLQGHFAQWIAHLIHMR